VSQAQYFIGLISGTSVDGVDAVVLKIDDGELQIIASHCEHYSDTLRKDVLSLAQPGDKEIDRLGVIDQQVADVFAQAAKVVLHRAGLSPDTIKAIGSHGQTIRHRPSGSHPFTLQIGDPNRIAERTGITTVADFRRRDMAAGGQGAPLAPAFHRAAFGAAGADCAIVNIGGIANATFIDQEGRLLGYDTGPGNTLMDFWIRQHRGQSFDEDGAWARTGTVDDTLLTRLLQDPYFDLCAPKSTGPEYFSPSWLEPKLDAHIAAEQVQRTLLETTAITIANQCLARGVGRVAICGGGARNSFLMERLAALMAPAQVTTTEDFGIDPDWVEAACFAWLAHRTLAGLPGNEPTVTGASGLRVLGAIYPA